MRHLPPLTVRQWLAEAYPRRARLHAEIGERLAHRAEMRVSPPDKSFFGQAFEYAIGLDLAVEPPYSHLLDCLTQTQAGRLLRLAGYRPPDADATASWPLWRKPSGPSCPARLFTAASCLASVNEATRVLKRVGCQFAISLFCGGDSDQLVWDQPRCRWSRRRQRHKDLG